MFPSGSFPFYVLCFLKATEIIIGKFTIWVISFPDKIGFIVSQTERFIFPQNVYWQTYFSQYLLFGYGKKQKSLVQSLIELDVSFLSTLQTQYHSAILAE